ncbi:MAG: D-glycero-beta-D-manno-heptose 1-phosphate adenylyltransferase [Deltaproteobacteria bacterium]|nr:D-glycero-beta-D-manno-heptose 1-phosphate adenylyltransferase [Deltaproteobacteria bacterium]MBW2117727.1 D-glycero-beta-D-manno-heptose 1-phosphate adenylyltransferase [Deltaproteobacteria bacterium]MBW2344701.1 D-glycero-beta-D-manno-heptose 1-phosphate adenylyltransferase [Deltaproteobacteria bacterium]
MENYRQKIKTLEKANEVCDRIKALGQKTVFTNGCFDILHPGHTRYLCAARGLGDHLIVAVNSDRSVRAIKGPERPIQTEQTRTEILAALSCVDTVIIFDEDNPKNVIRHLLPDILVKGGDWAEDEIIGSDVVKAAGGEVKRIPFEAGFSTTDLIEKIRKLQS